MNEAKHTPGTWEAIGNLVRSPIHQPEGLPRGVQIADCRDGYFLAHTEEAKANARLIAAAPELLAALRSIADCCDEDHAARDYASRQTEIRGVARAAIAKVEGN